MVVGLRIKDIVMRILRNIRHASIPLNYIPSKCVIRGITDIESRSGVVADCIINEERMMSAADTNSILPIVVADPVVFNHAVLCFVKFHWPPGGPPDTIVAYYPPV